jgi:hypothetical protein
MPFGWRALAVTMHSCGAPIPSARLLEYWLDEISGEEESALDLHLLGCDHCSARLRELVALGARIRSVRGSVQAVISDRLLQKLAREGAQVREYDLFPGGSVNCTVAPGDDLVVARLHASLAGVERLDLVFVDVFAEGEHRLTEIPFNAATGSVLLMPPLDVLRRQLAHTARMRLIAVSAASESVLGEYLFNHSPWQDSPTG